jgi:Type II secretion system (T2SS), protein M subtype b
MSQEQSIRNNALPGRQQIRVRFDRLTRSQLNVIGVPELVGITCAVLLALFTAFLYVYLLVPARARVHSAELDRERLQGQVRAAEINVSENSTTKETVDKINASMEDFESNWLVSPSSGRMSLYTDLNDLIRSNGLRNTAGPSYTALEPLGAKTLQQALAGADKKSNAKWQSVYPGISVSVTVEGPYQNVRHFVHDIEMSRAFLVINAIELESVNQSSTISVAGAEESRVPPPRTTRPGAPTPTNRTPPVAIVTPPLPGTRGTTVSLRLDMATYFQRDATQSVASNP